jgi:hypothetical protein
MHSRSFIGHNFTFAVFCSLKNVGAFQNMILKIMPISLQTQGLSIWYSHTLKNLSQSYTLYLNEVGTIGRTRFTCACSAEERENLGHVCRSHFCLTQPAANHVGDEVRCKPWVTALHHVNWPPRKWQLVLHSYSSQERTRWFAFVSTLSLFSSLAWIKVKSALKDENDSAVLCVIQF